MAYERLEYLQHSDHAREQMSNGEKIRKIVLEKKITRIAFKKTAKFEERSVINTGRQDTTE